MQSQEELWTYTAGLEKQWREFTVWSVLHCIPLIYETALLSDFINLMKFRFFFNRMKYRGTSHLPDSSNLQ